MAIDPAGSYLWIATTAGITPYAINSSTGALTAGSVISAFGDPAGVGALQVDPSGKWLLDASLSGILYAFPITTSGTEDTSRSIQTTAQMAGTTVQPGGIAFSPSGSANPIVAVALKTSGTQVFPFTSGSAAPIGSPYSPTITTYGEAHGQSGTAAAVSVAIDPSNPFLYIGETDAFPGAANGDTGALRVYAISAGAVNEITYASSAPTTPYASGGSTPDAILPSSNGYVYVANWQGTGNGSLDAFLLTASTPSLTLQANPMATGEEPVSIAEDSTGDFVLVLDNNSTSGGTTFDAYTFDASTTGLLDFSASGSTGTTPVAIVAVPK
jgi:6-phosphogluconolactonase (cycloisomerase 2 family)